MFSVTTAMVVLHVPTAFVVLHTGQGVPPVVYMFRFLVVLLAVACLGVAVFWGLLLVERLRAAVGGREGVDDHGP